MRRRIEGSHASRGVFALAATVLLIVVACGTPAPSPDPSLAFAVPTPLPSQIPAATPTPAAAPSASTPPGGEPQPAPEVPSIKPIPLDVRLRDAVDRPGISYAIGDTRRGGVVWSAINGQDWIVDSDAVTFDGAHLQAIAARDSTLVIVGCRLRLASCDRGATWIHDKTWRAVPDHGLFAHATFDGVTATATAFVAWGLDAGRPAAWSSPDGRSWHRAGSFSAPKSTVITGIAASTDGLVAVGRVGGRATTWASTNGATWTARPWTQPTDDLETVSWGSAGFIAAGSIAEASPEDITTMIARPAIWTSADGASWTQQTILGPEVQDVIVSVAANHGSLLALGQSSSAYSTDGTASNWSTLTFDGFPRRVVTIPGGFLTLGDVGVSPVAAAAFHAPIDPLQGNSLPQWSRLPDMPLVRPGATGAPDGNGGILIFSDAGGGALRIDRLDMQRPTWSRKATISVGISHAQAVADGHGRIYLVGVTPDGRGGRLIRYVPKTGGVTVLRPLPTARTGAGVTLAADGALYVLGGMVSPCCDGVRGDGATRVVERFDPRTGTWSRRAPLPVADTALSAAAAGRSIYAFLPARVWRYDYRHDRWSAGPAGLSYGVTGEATLGGDDLIRVFSCGRYDIFDPGKDHWQPGQVMQTPRCHPVVVLGDQTMYVFGGIDTAETGRVVESAFAGGG